MPGNTISLLGKVVFYVVFLSLGALIGIYLVGDFLVYRITFEGIPVSALTPEQMTHMLTRNPDAMKTYTSLVVGGKRIFTVGGGWLMWVVVLAPTVVFGFLSHVLVKLHAKRRRLPST